MFYNKSQVHYVFLYNVFLALMVIEVQTIKQRILMRSNKGHFKIHNF